MREIKFKNCNRTEKKRYFPFTLNEAVEWNGKEVDPENEVCQFTGLHKNGKEIYEGDILCFHKYEGKEHQTRWVVEWNEKQGRWSEWLPREGAEIIGNVYEKPELLTKTA
jgi:hypothetical protein